jgi:ring-1,2-phenylacetyl-CoA epoxidase subunit PaaE
MSSTQFYELRIKAVRNETAEAVTLVLDVPEHLKETFAYTQGQYLTLRFHIKGQEVRRAYSMCSSPLETDPAVTVKRVRGGLVSNFINDHVGEGYMVEVMPPQGRFFTPLKPEQRKDYYLIGAGSGITPLMSILKTILEEEPQSTVNLLYGNRSEDCILFREELDRLAVRYEDQFFLQYILSQPKREKSSGIAGWFSKGSSSWTGWVGRIDRAVMARFLAAYPQRAKEAVYFICGPGEMIDVVELALQGHGVDKKAVHTERFVTAAPAAGAPQQVDVADVSVVVHIHADVYKFELAAGKTILDGLLDKKIEVPYSCTSGACSTCMAKINKGTARMDACYGLDESEVAQGYILTCQAHPTSPELEITFDL